MAGNTKEIRVRIKSVSSTLQLTKAMELVASSKIRRATDRMLRGREYLANLESTIALLSANGDCKKSPYMQVREEGRTRVVVIAGDRGLAGGYNANVFRLAATLGPVEFIPVGKRACDRFGTGYPSAERFSFEEAWELAGKLCSDFAAGKFDTLGILYTRYRSVMTQEAEYRTLLPFKETEAKGSSFVLFEPDPLTVFDNVVREYVAGVITTLARESFACEIASRRMAMDSAGKNARQMIDDLQLEYNRARQGAITQEITEIVAGSSN